ncbi:hypothetical protein Hanom_Chr16g01483521 [Helianthus anomalus]
MFCGENSGSFFPNSSLTLVKQRFDQGQTVVSQVRIQLGQGSAVSVTKEMLKNEGVGAFYKVWTTHICVISVFVVVFVTTRTLPTLVLRVTV